MATDIAAMADSDVAPVGIPALVVVMVAAANCWNDNDKSDDPEIISTASTGGVSWAIGWLSKERRNKAQESEKGDLVNLHILF